MRKVRIIEGEYYHVFNRGVEKRDTFLDLQDLDRFLKSLDLFNTEKPIGSIFENQRERSSWGAPNPLVDILCYCLNPNHFHLLIYQRSERGIQRFMHRLGTGYTNYFNEKYRRSGVLFQGKYKAVHQESNEQLLHTSVYVNLNNRFGSSTPTLSVSSWPEYQSGTTGLCKTDMIIKQFSNRNEYIRFAQSSLKMIIERKRQEKETQWLLAG